MNSATNEEQTHEWSEELLQAIQRLGVDGYREGQKGAMDAALMNMNVFVLKPTGGGKSLCFQAPAIIQEGITIVITPLKSLMLDQVVALQKLDVAVASWCGETKKADTDAITAAMVGMAHPALKLLYVTPERVLNRDFLELLKTAHSKNRIRRFVIDEAHCVSHWGHDFRAEYADLGKLNNTLVNVTDEQDGTMGRRVPIMLLTATANKKVQMDIVESMGLSTSVSCDRPEYVHVIRSSFNRPNLHYAVIEKTGGFRETARELFERLRTMELLNSSGIIYCFSKKNCEDLSNVLNELFGEYLDEDTNRFCEWHATHDKFALPYHAEVPNRPFVQEKWMNNSVSVVCATVAFGMGINKPDVKYVYHHTPPKSIEAYVQESGRAGRNGCECDCVIYYNNGEERFIRKLVSQQDNNNDRRTSKGYELVTQETVDKALAGIGEMFAYCRNKTVCRRTQQLIHFQEKFDAVDCHATCDNCKRKNRNRQPQQQPQLFEAKPDRRNNDITRYLVPTNTGSDGYNNNNNNNNNSNSSRNNTTEAAEINTVYPAIAGIVKYLTSANTSTKTMHEVTKPGDKTPVFEIQKKRSHNNMQHQNKDNEDT